MLFPSFRVQAAPQAPREVHWLHCRLWCRWLMLHHLSPVYALYIGGDAPGCSDIPLFYFPVIRLSGFGGIWDLVSPRPGPVDRSDASHPIQVQNARVSIPTGATTVCKSKFSSLGVLLGIFQHCLWSTLVL